MTLATRDPVSNPVEQVSGSDIDHDQVVGFGPGEVVDDHLCRVGEGNCLHRQPDRVFHLD